jgi:hypothetical protein
MSPGRGGFPPVSDDVESTRANAEIHAAVNAAINSAHYMS